MYHVTSEIQFHVPRNSKERHNVALAPCFLVRNYESVEIRVAGANYVKILELTFFLKKK